MCSKPHFKSEIEYLFCDVWSVCVCVCGGGGGGVLYIFLVHNPLGTNLHAYYMQRDVRI